jgi:hypothetical protein
LRFADSRIQGFEDSRIRGFEDSRLVQQAAEKRSLKEKGKRKKAENLRVFLLPSSFFLDSVSKLVGINDQGLGIEL